MAIELKVPAVGESITEVEIGDWLKPEGADVQRDENVVTLESEKATVELPAPAAGHITKILKKKGQTAAVGEVIAYLEPIEAKSGATPAKAAAPAAPPSSTPPSEPQKTSENGNGHDKGVEPRAATPSAPSEPEHPGS